MTRAWQIASAIIVTVMTGLGLGIPAASASSVPPGSHISLKSPLTLKAPAAPAAARSKPAPAPVASHRMARLVLITCSGRPANRPRSFGLSCGDDADSLARLHWSSWNPGRAVAQGTQRIDSCLPNCARGTSTRYRVTVILSGSERVARHARERRYAKITLRYHDRHPAGVAPRVTGNLWP